MFTQLDEEIIEGGRRWCRDCSFASKKSVEKLKLSIYCSEYEDVFPAFERACENFREDGNRRFATGQGLLKYIKEKNERKAQEKAWKAAEEKAAHNGNPRA